MIVFDFINLVIGVIGVIMIVTSIAAIDSLKKQNKEDNAALKDMINTLDIDIKYNTKDSENKLYCLLMHILESGHLSKEDIKVLSGIKPIDTNIRKNKNAPNKKYTKSIH
jgi:hypothetical protein